MKTLLAAISTIAVLLLVGSSVSSVYAEVPSWVKNNAGWWAEGTIDDDSFVQGIQFLIKEGIMEIPATTQGTSSSNEIPSWIKNNAGWWAEGTIDDDSFVQGIQFLNQRRNHEYYTSFKNLNNLHLLFLQVMTL